MKKLSFIILVALFTIISTGANCKTNDLQTDSTKTRANKNETKIEISIDETTMEQMQIPNYTEEELDLVARIIWAEAGSDWITDEHQRAVASVVINRKNDSRFPNSIKDVVYQKGQYGCVDNGMINRIPNQRAYDNAKYVLDNGVTIPDNIVWQAQFPQGKGVYKHIQGHYFCY